MNRGKDICKELKAVRKQIAEENGIALEIPECTYQGPCKGTCPRCESEVRFLENALAEKMRLGKVATVAGLALALSATAQAQDVSIGRQPAADSVKVERTMAVHALKGTVIDEKSKELAPFVNVVVKKDGKPVAGAVTDFDGNFRIDLPEGEYELEISCIGYMRYLQTGVKVPMKQPLAVELKPSSDGVMGLIPVEVGGVTPLIDVTTPGITEGMKVQGVQVKVQY